MPETDYTKITAAIHYIRSQALKQPQLDDIAAHAGLSPFHFQRLFQRWAGVSPKRFLQYLTSQHAKELLMEPCSLLDTSHEVGLSGGGRLHDLFVSIDAVTPGEFKTGGAGLKISWGIHPTPFGQCLIGVTTRGICSLQFFDDNRQRPQDVLLQNWPQAKIIEDRTLTKATVEDVFALLDGKIKTPLPLLVKGTNLQIKVWQALLKIPCGQVASYGQVAKSIGNPRAARAVGSAIGSNPIAWLIPCHRVLRGDGNIGGYRWGEDRKLAILGREWALKEQQPTS